eukprot:2415442-Rhodomonas_salina.1
MISICPRIKRPATPSQYNVYRARGPKPLIPTPPFSPRTSVRFEPLRGAYHAVEEHGHYNVHPPQVLDLATVPKCRGKSQEKNPQMSENQIVGKGTRGQSPRQAAGPGCMFVVRGISVRGICAQGKAKQDEKQRERQDRPYNTCSTERAYGPTTRA